MHQPDTSVLAVSLQVLRELSCPTANTLIGYIKEGRWLDIASMRVSPSDFSDYTAFRKAYQATELLRKFDDLQPRGVQRKVAIEGFLESERTCAKTNARLDPLLHSSLHESGYGVRLETFVQGVKKRIRAVLGRLPPTLDVRFGPGSTFESEHRAERRSWNLGDKITTYARTASTAPLTKFVDETAWGRAWSSGTNGLWIDTVVRGNRFTTVPKDALKDRGICIEPGINISLQLAVGAEIRSRLKSVGIDLNHGQALHGLLAELHCGVLATIDLSSASDTVARKLVELLLPSDWYHLLNSLRSPLTRMKGKWYYLEKFSSMGNGFTFELETLIFWAIAQEISGEDLVSVYGDDIIVLAEHAESVLSALAFFGFTPNPKKTFKEGPFRESCGTDTWNGIPVPVFRFTTSPKIPFEWFPVHNRLRYLGFSPKVLMKVVDQIPRHSRLYGPTTCSQVLHHPERRYWKIKEVDGCTYVRGWVVKASKVAFSHFKRDVQLALALYGVPSDGVGYRGSVAVTKRWFSMS